MRLRGWARGMRAPRRRQRHRPRLEYGARPASRANKSAARRLAGQRVGVRTQLASENYLAAVRTRSRRAARRRFSATSLSVTPPASAACWRLAIVMFFGSPWSLLRSPHPQLAHILVDSSFSYLGPETAEPEPPRRCGVSTPFELRYKAVVCSARRSVPWVVYQTLVLFSLSTAGLAVIIPHSW